MYAKIDIHSHIRPDICYAKKGEQIEIITQNMTTALCRSESGVTFPTNFENLSETKVEKDQIIEPKNQTKKK
jgi:hypothetical protein